nr:MAG TPA: hypothetical protein [Caudoviricetes sp.]
MARLFFRISKRVISLSLSNYHMAIIADIAFKSIIDFYKYRSAINKS